MSVEGGALRDGANAVTTEVDDNHVASGVKWSLEYCSEEPTNVSSGGGATA